MAKYRRMSSFIPAMGQRAGWEELTEAQREVVEQQLDDARRGALGLNRWAFSICFVEGEPPWLTFMEGIGDSRGSLQFQCLDCGRGPTGCSCKRAYFRGNPF